MSTPSSIERTNEILASGFFRCDGRILQLMIEYQDQLVDLLADCTESERPGDGGRQKDRFIEQVYFSAEAFNMITLATIHIFTEKAPQNPDVKRMFASLLMAGLKSAIVESMIEHCKSPQELITLMQEINERANGYHLKQALAGRKAGRR